MRKNQQNVVLKESSKAFGNRSEIVRILVLTLTRAEDDASGINFSDILMVCPVSICPRS